MPSRYIPRADAELDGWAANLADVVAAHTAQAGLTAADGAAIKSAVDAWRAAFESHIAARGAAEAARARKDAARAALEAAVRPRVRVAQACPQMTDALRAAMGVAVGGRGTGHRAPGTGEGAGGVGRKPLVMVGFGERLRHLVRVVDAGGGGVNGGAMPRTARPRGAHGAQIWVAVVDRAGAAPADPAAYRYLRTATRGRTVAAFSAEEAGKMAAYLARWVSPTGAVGPWSDAAMATIAA